MTQAAAEREKGVGVDAGVEEAVGPEGLGLGPDVGPPVGEVKARQRETAGRQLVAADAHRRFNIACHGGKDGIEAGRFLDDRVEILEFANPLRREPVACRTVPRHRRKLGLSRLQHLRVLQQPVNHPRQRGRRGLVPGHQQGDQFVANFLVAHGLTVLVAGGNEHRHDVGAGIQGLLPAAGNLIVQQVVDFALQSANPSPGRKRPHIDLQLANQHHRATADQAQKHDEQRTETRQPVALFHPEHGAQDDVQRDPLHMPVNRENLFNRPAVDRTVHGLPHDVAVQPHPIAVKRRHEQLALAPVPGAVKQQDGIGTEDGSQHFVAAPGEQGFGVTGEDVPDGGGVAEKYEWRGAVQAHREDVAVGRDAGVHERDGPFYPLQHLKDAWESWSGG